MVAGNEADPRRIAQPPHEVGGQREFRGKRDVNEIAATGDVVGPLIEQIGKDPVKHGHVMRIAALAQPIDIAGQSLAEQIGERGPWQGPQMWIGKKGQTKHQARCKPDGAAVKRCR